MALILLGCFFLVLSRACYKARAVLKTHKHSTTDISVCGFIYGLLGVGACLGGLL